jgi:hypothetical protein
MEDNDYLGDHGYVQGVDFDLDEYNGRWCVTPEFPNGTYAYFVSIASNGTPTFPYNIGRAYYGSATGGTVTGIAEMVVTNFVGGPNGAFSIKAPAVESPTVTLAWSSVDGGTYQVESSTDLNSWNTNVTGVASQGIDTQTNLNGGAAAEFYRVARTGLANYDPVTNTASGGGGATIALTPNAGSRGQSSISITAVISASATPPVPPHTGAPVQTFTIGAMTVTTTASSYTYNGGTGTVTGTLSISADASLNGQTVTITFSPPPGQTSGPSYVQANGFTVNP